jgi:hypothetical protein
MKPLFVITLSVMAVFATSCGLSEKEKTEILQAQQTKDDSIRVAEIQKVKDEDALRSAFSDSITNYNNILVRQQNALVQLRTSIYMANDEMTQIKAFHLGRLPQDKETQINSQELKIQTLVLQQSNLQTAIQHTVESIARLKSELVVAR